MQKKPLVLVVDDDAGERLLICEALLTDGFDTSEAENGQEALEKVVLQRPDIILMDIIMPEMDGFAACAALRAMPGIEHVPIMMVTGLNDTASVEWGYHYGATDFITKPLNWRMLQHRVRYVLRNSQLLQRLHRSEANERALVNAVPDTIIRFHRDGTVIDFKAGNTCQPPPVGENGFHRLPQSIREQFLSAVELALEHKTIQLFDCEVATKGKLTQHEVRIVAIAEEQAVAIIRDITERKQTEEKLRMMSHALEQSPVSVVITDMLGYVKYVNPRFTEVTGYRSEDVLSKPSSLLNPTSLSNDTTQHVWPTIEQGKVWRGEYSNLRKNGEPFWESVQISAIRDSTGSVTHFISVKEDITAHKMAQDRVRFLAYHDCLTRLPNRDFFQEHLQQTLELNPGQLYPVAVFLLDLDQFKRINDFFGHRVGDLVLQRISERLKTCLRKGIRENSADANTTGQDMLARLEGDEFALLLAKINGPENADQVGARILDVLSASFEVEDVEVFVTVSMGIAVYPRDGENAESLLKHANTALDHAKKQGRNTYRFYYSWMDAASLHRLSLENQLRRALQREEFSLDYQPLVALNKGRIVGAEALLRWHNPHLGSVAPADFIPLAEDFGLISGIGEWVLYSACAQNDAWRKMGLPNVVVSVNLSKHQLRNRGIAQTIKHVLGMTGLESRGLELELTESMVMRDPDIVASILDSIRDLGVRIAMDDFGTGYSCFSYLMQLPVDTLKIDKSFLENLSENARKAAIVRTIIAVARHLKLQVVAEGVERPQQMRFLGEEGCDLVQGYLTGPPVNPKQFSRLLAQVHVDEAEFDNKQHLVL